MRTRVFFLLLFLVFINPYGTSAQERESDSYRLKLNDIRYDEPTPIPHVNPSDSVLYGDEAKSYDEHGFVIQTDLEDGLTFNISRTRVNIDPQPMDAVVEQDVSLSVAADERYSYQVLGVQQRTMATGNNAQIDNTACDIAFLPCTSSLARKWSSAGAYGFGYRLKGDDVSPDFHDSSHYRPFPLNSKNQAPVLMMQNINSMGTRQNQMYLKVVFPPTYQQGTYIGDLSIITLPKL